MRQYISVDVYGNCGNLTCAHNFDCFEKLGEVSCFYNWKFHKNSEQIFRLILWGIPGGFQENSRRIPGEFQ